MSFELLRDPHERLIRRDSPCGLAVHAEEFDPDTRMWRPAHHLLEASEFKPISPEQGLELVGDEDLLEARPDLAAELRSERGECYMLTERLEWIEEAITATVALIEANQGEAVVDMVLARFHTEDYDYAIDTVGWIRCAWASVDALLAEHRLLTRRERMRRENYG